MLKLEIIFDDSLIRELLMILKQAGIRHYTLLENVKGMGHSGGKFDNSTAPGRNSILIAVVADEQAEGIVKDIHKFKETNPALGVRAIVTEIREWV